MIKGGSGQPVILIMISLKEREIIITAALDGELFSDTPELRTAEITGSVLYATMQCHYAWCQTTNLHSMQRALQNYYDRDMEGMLRWMQLSIIILMVLALMAPLLIFGSGPWLAIYAIFFITSIFYLVDTFCNYVLISAPEKMEEAEDSEEKELNEKNPFLNNGSINKGDEAV